MAYPLEAEMMAKVWTALAATAVAIALMAPAAQADATRSGWAGDLPGEPVTGREIDVSTTIGHTGLLDTHISDYLVNLIDRAEIQIVGNVYTAESDDPVRAALVRAKARGVKVMLTYDGGENDNVKPTDTIRDDTFDWVNVSGQPARLSKCPNGCHYEKDGGRAHSKFFVFDRTQRYNGQIGSAVWIGSSNLTLGSGRRASNMAITYWNDADLHKRMSEIFQDGFDHFEPTPPDWDYYQPNRGWSDRFSGVAYSAASASVVHTSPDSPTGGGDVWLDQLAHVNPGTGCTIRIAMAQITNARIAVVDRIRSLAGSGCQVRLLLGLDENGAADIEDTPGGARSRLCNAPNVQMMKRERMHEKGLSIVGSYEGKAGRKQVFMGSHNWTGPALRWNDEILLRVADSADAYDAFYRHFNAMWYPAAGDTKTTYLTGTPNCAGRP